MNTEMFSYQDQPDSKEPRARALYMNSTRNTYARAFANLGAQIRENLDLSRDNPQYERLLQERAVLAISADILCDLLILPDSQKKHVIERAIIQDPSDPFSDTNLTGKVCIYSNAVTRDNSITPLDPTTDNLAPELKNLEQEIAEQIAGMDSLPDDHRLELQQAPSTLPFKMRIYKHCVQQELLVNPEPKVTKTHFWLYSLLNPRGVDNLPESIFGGNDPYEITVRSSLPPVKPDQIRKSGRIHIVGTRVETTGLAGILDKFPKTNEDISPTSYCSNLDTFWQRFFDCKDFLDDKERRNIPRQIYSTGLIRGYGSGGYTTNVMGVLERLAEKYNIELVKLTSFAP